MQDTSFTIVEWEHVLDRNGYGDSAPTGSSIALFDSRLKWQQVLPLQPCRGPSSTILKCNEYNRKLSEDFDGIRRGGRWPSAAIFSLNEISIIGEESLLLDMPSKSIICGSALGSSISFVKDYLKHILSARGGRDSHEIVFDDGLLLDSELHTSGLLLVSPGQSVYGHWLMDYIPRLFIAELLGLNQGTIYVTRIHTWTETFFRLFGISMSQVCVLSNNKNHKMVDVKSISVLKSGYLIDRAISKLAWDIAGARIAAYYGRPNVNLGDKLFVSRQGWHSRALENEQALINRASLRGYRVVYPERHSIAEQVAIFRKARLVVGPDGSGLHNIIFSDPGARLAVILLPGRGQLWHATLCDALGHKVIHIEASLQRDGNVTISIEDLDKLLTILESD